MIPLSRGKDAVSKEWVYGYPYVTNEGECEIRYYDAGVHIENMGRKVIKESVGQETGMTEFVVSDPSVNGRLFEGDIVEVWSRRRCPWEGVDWEPKSQYDTVRKVRAVIVFRNGSWQLDYKNAYNKAMEDRIGTETRSRTVEASNKLYSYGYHGECIDWFRKSNEKNFWRDIIKIGNVFDNPTLLEAQNKK